MALTLQGERRRGGEERGKEEGREKERRRTERREKEEGSGQGKEICVCYKTYRVQDSF